MAVKINVKMPKSCAACGFCSYNDGEGFAEDYYNCVINGQFLGIEPSGTKRHPQCPLQEVKECIWHKKTERPEKKLHCTRLIVTKFGSVFDEKEIDSGAYIETDWAYLDDLIECAKVKE